MKVILEKHTENFIKTLQSKGGKPIYQHTPKEARGILEKIQSGPIDKPQVKIEEKTIHIGSKKELSILIIRPKGTTEVLPVIMFYHGAGWVMGSATTHDRLARELAVGAHAAVVFVNYTRSPEAKSFTVLEEAYGALKYISEHGKKLHLNTSHLAVAGDSVGGNMAIAMTMLAKQRHGPKINCQVLFYPVTSSELNTASYAQFHEGPWLTKPAMEWFWNAYEPDVTERKKPLLSPLQATVEDLKGLPPALVITAENDVLRDEGEHYAHKLMVAGVDVTAMRFMGTIHDFVMLHALAHTPAACGAIALASTYLHEKLSKQVKKSRTTKKAA